MLQNQNSVLREAGWVFSREPWYPLEVSNIALQLLMKNPQSLIRHMLLDINAWVFISVKAIYLDKQLCFVVFRMETSIPVPSLPKNPNKKLSKKGVYHLPHNIWALRVMDVPGGVFLILILLLTHSSLNAYQADYEVSLQEFKQGSQLFGKQCLWFLWFGSNKHLTDAAAQCCPQRTIPDSWSIIRTGVPPRTCLEDDSLWQWRPEPNTL